MERKGQQQRPMEANYESSRTAEQARRFVVIEGGMEWRIGV